MREYSADVNTQRLHQVLNYTLYGQGGTKVKVKSEMVNS
jgi:hypothetical protein